MNLDRKIAPRIRVECSWEEIEEEGAKYVRVLQRSQLREVFLTSSAMAIWKLIDQDRTVGEIIDGMKAQDTSEGEVHDVLGYLYDLKLIEEPEAFLWRQV